MSERSDTRAFRLNDQELVRACQEHPRRYFQELYDRFENVVRWSCYRVTRDPQDAEDAAQETFLALFEQIHTFRLRGPFRSWLRMVARNTSLNWLRRSRRPVRSLEDEELELQAPELRGPADGLEERELRAVLKDVVRALPPKHREVSDLRFLKGRPYEDIAATLGLPRGTVKSRVNRARHRLQRAIERRGLSLVG